MPSFHAGQRLPAGHLNAQTIFVAGVAGANIAATETEIGTITIPALPMNVQHRISLDFIVNPDNAGSDARWRGRVRIGSTTGAVVVDQFMQYPNSSSAAARFPLIASDVNTVPAGSSVSYVATLVRDLGSGSAGVQLGGLRGMRVEIKPTL